MTTGLSDLGGLGDVQIVNTLNGRGQPLAVQGRRSVNAFDVAGEMQQLLIHSKPASAVGYTELDQSYTNIVAIGNESEFHRKAGIVRPRLFNPDDARRDPQFMRLLRRHQLAAFFPERERRLRARALFDYALMVYDMPLFTGDLYSSRNPEISAALHVDPTIRMKFVSDITARTHDGEPLINFEVKLDYNHSPGRHASQLLPHGMIPAAVMLSSDYAHLVASDKMNDGLMHYCWHTDSMHRCIADALELSAIYLDGDDQ